GFGSVRRAELEFSFGRSVGAEQALAEAGEQARENAQAVALRGFLSWARQDYGKALIYFKQESSLDTRLGECWLGIGLRTFRMEDMFYYLRRGQPFGYWRAQPNSEALRALERAAAVEPERSLLRSYLGKAYYEAAGILPNPQLRSNALEQLHL